MHVLIRKYLNLIDVTLDGASPTPGPLIDLLAPPLTYMQREQLRGADAYDPITNTRQRVRLTERRLWTLSEDMKFTTSVGLMQKVCRILQDNGYVPHYKDITPARERPNAYDGSWENVLQYITFRARQQDCLQAIINNPCGVIKAVTGFGKGVILAAVCLYYPKAKIDIIIESLDIANDLQRRLTEFIPGVGIINGTKNKPGRVTIVSAGSLHKVDGLADFVLGDECHTLGAPSYAEPLGYKYRWARCYGFSATPHGRSDGTEARIEGLFGPIIFEITYQEAEALGLVVPVRVHWLPIEMTKNPVAGYTADTAKKRWGIWRNDVRNAAYANHIHETYAADKQVLALVESIEHAVYLKRFLPEFELAYSNMKQNDFLSYVASGLLPASFPEMTPERRIAMKTAFKAGTLKRVIATDVWSTGVDFEALEVVARLDEREGEVASTQGPGRATRILTTAEGSKAYGDVIDAIDYWDENFKRKSRARFNIYDGMGWGSNWPTGRRNISERRGPR